MPQPIPSTPKHTPGPWILASLPTSVGTCHKIGPFPAAGGRPYTFACVYADGIRLGIDDNLPAAQELMANARLMAAAPDLLEALITLSTEEFRDDDDPILDAARQKARAAIAKAGAQP